MLGLDPDFIVFLQDGSSTGPADSFDIFVDKIKEADSNKPLTVALSETRRGEGGLPNLSRICG